MGIKSVCRQILFRTLGVVDRLRCDAGQSILLTFDDGPHPEFTPAILDRLARHDARAVFFAIGVPSERYPEVLRRVLSEGHEVGNHTFTHQTHPFLHVRSYLRDVSRCQEALEAAIGSAPRLFRAPRGRVTFGSLFAPKLLGLRSIYWSVDPKDAQLRDADEARRCGEQIAEVVRAGDVILLHDDHPFVLPLLDVLLPRLVERGFDLRRGKELL